VLFRTAVINDFKVIRDDEKIVVIIIDIDFVLDKWFLSFSIIFDGALREN
jgi:hypothetical protein